MESSSFLQKRLVDWKPLLDVSMCCVINSFFLMTGDLVNLLPLKLEKGLASLHV